jgi:hypothetical protein
MRNKPLHFYLFILACFPAFSFANDKYGIEGVVVDASSGEPRGNVYVRAARINTFMKAGQLASSRPVETDGQGRFRWQCSQSGM